MDDVLDLVFLNNPVKQWLVAAAFVLGGLAAGKAGSLIIAGAVKKGRKKTEPPADDTVPNLLRRPLFLFLFLCGAALGIAGLRLPETARLWADRIVGSVFIVIIAWALGRIADALILRYVPPRGLSSPEKNETGIQPLLRKFFNILAVLIAAVLILRTMGYNVSALMAGLGLGGAAIALASKDTLSNILGSVTVFMDKPFRLNDRIKIGDYDGFVTEMGLRTSRLRTLENRMVCIPNSLFASSPIENISAAPCTKITQTIRFRGDNGSEKIAQGIEILREIGSSTEGLEGNPVAGLAAPGGLICQATFIYFISKKAVYMDTINRVNLEVLRRFEEAGIRLV
ncbi:MAG: mechanosensitive ion channel family protein [Treponema sp.]|jgi:MscS family membrane protein|nr:mechanosensitive ion channel family protein [Treponema sp.]